MHERENSGESHKRNRTGILVNKDQINCTGLCPSSVCCVHGHVCTHAHRQTNYRIKFFLGVKSFLQMFYFFKKKSYSALHMSLSWDRVSMAHPFPSVRLQLFIKLTGQLNIISSHCSCWIQYTFLSSFVCLSPLLQANDFLNSLCLSLPGEYCFILNKNSPYQNLHRPFLLRPLGEG